MDIDLLRQQGRDFLLHLIGIRVLNGDDLNFVDGVFGHVAAVEIALSAIERDERHRQLRERGGRFRTEEADDLKRLRAGVGCENPYFVADVEAEIIGKLFFEN